MEKEDENENLKPLARHLPHFAVYTLLQPERASWVEKTRNYSPMGQFRGSITTPVEIEIDSISTQI